MPLGRVEVDIACLPENLPVFAKNAISMSRLSTLLIVPGLTAGVFCPLLMTSCSWAFLALCSASRFLSSAGDSNFGFLGADPP